MCALKYIYIIYLDIYKQYTWSGFRFMYVSFHKILVYHHKSKLPMASNIQAVSIKGPGHGISICLKENYKPGCFLEILWYNLTLNHGLMLTISIIIIIYNDCFCLTTLTLLNCYMFINRTRIGGTVTAVSFIDSKKYVDLTDIYLS